MPVRPATAAALMGLIVVSTTACDVEVQVRPEGMFERTLTVTAPVTLDIRTGSGSIEIHQGAAGGSVHVAARLRGARSWFDGDVAGRIRQIEAAPPIAQEGGVVRVGPMADDDRLYRNISISYDVTVPMETRVQSRSGSGSAGRLGVTKSFDRNRARRRRAGGAIDGLGIGRNRLAGRFRRISENVAPSHPRTVAPSVLREAFNPLGHERDRLLIVEDSAERRHLSRGAPRFHANEDGAQVGGARCHVAARALACVRDLPL